MPRDLTPRAKCRSAAAFSFDLFRAYLATLVMAAPCWSEPTGPAADVHGPEASGAQPSAPSAGFWKWFDPETAPFLPVPEIATNPNGGDRTSTRLNSSHSQISYAVFCLK